MIDYIRNQIKKRRVEKRLTQSDVAIDLGITPGAYSKIESGPTEISVKKLAAIAKVLEVDISYFSQKQTVSKVEEPNKAIGFATKSDIEELTGIINTLKQEIAGIKARLQTAAATKKKKI